MGDLISKSALLQDFRNTVTENSDTFDWLNMIARQPTAFDLESVIAKLKENEQDMIKAIEENTPSGFYAISVKDLKSIFGDYTKEQIEILKTAVNATNGEIGG